MPANGKISARREAALWLAAVLRDYSFATTPVPDVLRNAGGDAELTRIHENLRLQDVDAWRLSLPYEPRSLAVHPGGELVAVGTKAGTVHVVRWDSARGRWSYDETPHLHVKKEAVRALAFVGRSHIIVTRGAGYYRLASIDGAADVDAFTNVETRAISDSLPGHPWRLRIRRLIRTVSPSFDWDDVAPSDGVLAVALTAGGGAVPLGLGNVPSGSVAEAILARNRVARVLDGAWADDHHLFLLDSSGAISQFWVDGGRVLADEPVPLGPGFRSISACPAALALLARDEVLTIRLEPRDDSPLMGLHHSLSRARVSEATGIAVTLPFRDNERTLRATRPDPVFTVISTQRGLVVLSWIPDDEGRLIPGSEPRPTGLAERAVLYAAFGRRSAPGRRAAHFLAYGTRNSELILWSLVDRTPLRAMLREELQAEVEYDAKSSAPQSPVAQWAHAVRRIREGDVPHRTYDYVSLQRGTDLHRLLWRLLERLRSQAEAGVPMLVLRGSFEHWLYALLRRAHEIEDHDLPRRLGEDLRAGLRGLLAHDPSSHTELEVLGSFVGKWIVEGRTYGSDHKATCLTELIALNEDHHRDLDALVYLARLLFERIDRRWIAAPLRGSDSLSPGIWDMQTMPDGSFSVQAHADGNITAVGGNGGLLAWRVGDDVAERLANADLELHGGRLTHRRASIFRERYGYGPYARSIALLDGQHDERALAVIVFATKGFRREDSETCDGAFPPSLHALLVQATSYGLEILDVRSEPLSDELYGLCVFDRGTSTETGARSSVVVAGTNGWYGGARKPFVETRIAVRGSAFDHFYVHTPAFSLMQEETEGLGGTTGRSGEGHALQPDLPSTAGVRNPCIALAVEGAQCGEKAPTWVWAGFHDGHIRGYRYVCSDEGMSSWLEGGGAIALPQSDQQAPLRRVPGRHGLRAPAAIWALRCINGARRGPDRLTGLLAYGTADGVIGLVELDATGHSTRSPRHLVHSKERAPIARIVESVDEGRVRLVAFTHDGVGVFFDIGPSSDADQPHAQRAAFGERVERHRLAASGRAIAVVPPHDGKAPHLRVGTAEGEVHEVRLALPLGTKRRRRHAERLERGVRRCVNQQRDRGTHAYIRLTDVVADERAYAWLRVLPVGSDALAWASLWAELREKRPNTRAQLREPDAAIAQLHNKIKCFDDCAANLADEAYARRPFSADSAKFLWTEVGLVANRCLKGALDERAELPFRRELLRASERLLRRIDALNDRWAGFSASIEAPMLMHAGATLEWPAVAVLALPDGNTKLESELASLRPLLVRKILRRRLTHIDPLVTLETLRVLGRAMFQALQRGFNALVTAPEGAVPHTMIELLALVADAGVRLQSRLVGTDPLFTQMVRVLACGILLVPHAATSILEHLSERGLLEPSLDVRAALRVELEHLPAEISPTKPPLSMSLVSSEVLNLFDDYVGDKRGGAMSGIAALQPNRNFIEEQQRFRRAAEALLNLRDSGGDDALAWLDAGPQMYVYFSRSPRVLRYLREQRKKVAAELERPAAIKRCRMLLDWLGTPRSSGQGGNIAHLDVYDPHRSEWGKIPAAWIETLERERAEIEQNREFVLDTAHELSSFYTEMQKLLAAAREQDTAHARRMVRLAQLVLWHVRAIPYAIRRSTKRIGANPRKSLAAPGGRGKAEGAARFWFHLIVLHAIAQKAALLHSDRQRIAAICVVGEDDCAGMTVEPALTNPNVDECFATFDSVNETRPWPLPQRGVSDDFDIPGLVGLLLLVPVEAIRNAIQAADQASASGKSMRIDVHVAVRAGASGAGSLTVSVASYGRVAPAYVPWLRSKFERYADYLGGKAVVDSSGDCLMVRYDLEVS